MSTVAVASEIASADSCITERASFVQPSSLCRLIGAAVVMAGTTRIGNRAGTACASAKCRTQYLTWHMGMPCSIAYACCDRPLACRCAMRSRHSFTRSEFGPMSLLTSQCGWPVQEFIRGAAGHLQSFGAVAGHVETRRHTATEAGYRRGTFDGSRMLKWRLFFAF